MREAVRKLAEYEGRPEATVARDLAAPPGDVLRLRLSAASASAGTLALDDGLRLFAAAKALLTAAACSARFRRAFHYRSDYAPVTNFLAGCRLGQTELGSYVATVIGPPPPADPASLFAEAESADTPEDAPFERRTTLLLMQGLGSIRSALDRGRQSDPGAADDAVQRGASVNLCRALTDLGSVGEHSSLEVGVSWSRTRPRVEAVIPSSVRFGGADLPYVAAFSEAIRKARPPRPETLVGLVVRLEAPETGVLTDPRRGRVIIKTLIDEKRERVEIFPTEDGYRLACEAHRRRVPIKATGLLRFDSPGRPMSLDALGRISIVEPTGPGENSDADGQSPPSIDH